ncbi:hypothetical protein niasHS_011190 [Heterodera schachtii]|uniref:ABC transmembrane type-1 domain-containing protein n=1 Tax=Heterodera schachtii TaxID=97005 RepID=A0ABD2J6J3_HETSC
MSVWIESKARRGILVPYLLNLASEALFRQAQNRRWIRRSPPPFPHFQSLLFGISVASAVALLSKKQPNGQKSLRSSEFWRSVLNKTIGFGEEEGQRRPILDNQQQIHQNRRFPSICGSKALDCPPKSHYKCALKATKLSLKNFSLSVAAFTLLKVFNSLSRTNTKTPRVVSSNKSIRKLFELLRVPTFIGALPLLCQFSQCFCAHFLPTKSATICRPIGVGISATVAMAFLWPNNTLALYAFWKMVEFAFFRLADSGTLPVLPWADALLFSVLSSYLLGLAVLEPHALRQNYYKFLCSVTGNRLQLLNRPMFDKFLGTSSSAVLYSDYRPEFLPYLRTINPAQYLPQMQIV